MLLHLLQAVPLGRYIVQRVLIDLVHDGFQQITLTLLLSLLLLLLLLRLLLLMLWLLVVVTQLKKHFLEYKLACLVVELYNDKEM